MFKMMNAEQYTEVAKEAWLNSGKSMMNFPYQDNEYNVYSSTSTDWPGVYIAPGNDFSAQVSLSSGTEKTTSRISATYYKMNNTIQTDSQERITLRFAQTANLSDRLAVNVGLTGSYNTNNLFTVTNSNYLGTLPIFSPYLEDGYTPRLYNKIWDESKQGWVMRKFFANMVPDRMYNDDTQRTTVLKTVAGAKLEIVKGLRLSNTFGFDLNYGNEDVYNSRKTLDGINGDTPVGSSSKYGTNYRTWSNSTVLSFDRKFGKFSIDLYGGIEFQDQYNRYMYISGSGFTNDYIKELEYAETISQYSNTNVKHTRKMSYFGRLSLGYDSRYYLSANFRRDGNSIFGEYSKWGTFWSVAGSWNIHKEHFFEVPWISMLKLKASYGKAGNSRIDATTATGTYNYSSSYQYGGVSGAQLGAVPNPGLSWESTYETNAGLTVEFNKKFSIELEGYYNYTTDLLSKVYVSRTISEDRMYANVGRMYNSGVELTLSASNVSLGPVKWDGSLIVSRNTNKILELKDHRPISFGETVWMEGYDSNTFMLIRWAGVDPQDGSPMWYDKDGNLTKVYSYDNRVPGKCSTPIATGGFTNSFSYGNLSFSFHMTYGIGGYERASYFSRYMSDGYDIVSGNQAVEIYLYRWRNPGDLTSFPKVSNTTQHSTSYNDRFLLDKTFFNLSNMALTYNFPRKIASALKLRTLSASLVCDNVYLFTPDQKDGLNSYKTAMTGYPRNRTFSVSLNIAL